MQDGSYVNCEFLDLGGKEEYNSLNKTHCKKADCFVLVYDITDSDSFELCKNFYKKEISENCKKGIKVILIGNKSDFEKDRKVSKEEAEEFAKKNNYYFKETSCENNVNVADAFETIIIVSYNDMMKNKKENLEEKIDVEKFQIEKSNSEILGGGGDNDLKSKKTEKKSFCCRCLIF